MAAMAPPPPASLSKPALISLRHLPALAGVLLLALLGGWLYADWIVQRHLAQVKAGLVNALAYTADAVQDEAAGAGPLGVVMLMGLNSSVIKATVSGDLVPDSAAVQVQLGISRKLFCADGAYVVNSEGVVVAHATVGNSSTGVKLGFRPSFKNALGGTPNFYAAVGTVTNDMVCITPRRCGRTPPRPAR